MSIRLLMGNEAIALGALRAGVQLVSGYPGTPSSEILETVARENPGDVYVEWSTNEKSALEVAAGAAYAGARAMVTMKQVGLNVASDPLMSLAYVGVKGGMVVVVADDPGPISSQTEQDTRHFAQFAHLPVFDPATPEEAYQMIQDAFAYSERYQTPVLLRPTTRVCHGCASIDIDGERDLRPVEGFIKDDSRWVIFPRASYLNHIKLVEREPVLAKDFADYPYNTLTGAGTLGIVCGGVSYAYAQEALAMLGAAPAHKLLRIATPYPFPESLALEFLEGVSEVLVLEELDPVLEDALLSLCGKAYLPAQIKGKRTGHVPSAGELGVESALTALAAFFGIAAPKSPALPPPPALPVRPPVLCAGCPHRASFYAVKRAMKGIPSVFCGDIGCYTLGNAAPLEMVDTCLCMGAGVTIAQGLARVQPDKKHFAFIGDSTFFHTGLAGVVNAAYNGTDFTLIVLDNATTAMTGQQPHPGTGKTMMRTEAPKIDIEAVLRALGMGLVIKADPLDLAAATEAVRRAAAHAGPSAVIFVSPCIAQVRGKTPLVVDEKCIGCWRCIRELGCPALLRNEKKAAIDPALCTGCGLCAQICPVDAIGEGGAGA
ncbi:MAG: indolepyruvate ferredoxin oxidoreductase subunit alpha [Oscillospiraceae bacterium]|nr:indolepyruvate ferredoxin oxidoreductase subunit alpha [Oscillospiraceae bacterium]